MRVTKSQLLTQFGALCRRLGRTDWQLEYVAEYGGYVIEEVDKENGCISHPFGPERRKLRRMSDAILIMMQIEHYLRK